MKEFTIHTRLSGSFFKTNVHNTWSNSEAAYLSHPRYFCFVKGVSEQSCQYIVMEKTLKGHLKMAEAQLIHLVQHQAL